MITREEAVEVIYAFINHSLLNDETNDQLEEIANCIAKEEDGLHLWGAVDSEEGELYTAVRSDLITPEYEQHMDELYQKYAFTPSPFEMPDFRKRFEEYEDEDVEPEETEKKE